MGDENRPPRIFHENEEIKEGDESLIEELPETYRADFTRDPDKCVRDVLAIPTMAVAPFFRNRVQVHRCFNGRKVAAMDTMDLQKDVFTTRDGLHFMDHERLRWVHLDLALSRDSAGIACGYIQQIVTVDGTNKPGIVIDFILEVEPPPGGEIEFSKIRHLLSILIKRYQLKIKWVSTDGYQSADMRQILSRAGIETGLRSLDKTPEGYQTLKECLYEGRLIAPPHAKTQRELVTLEFDIRRGKIDHPVTGSKDCADSLAGVVWGLTYQRAAWADHGAIPFARSQTVAIKAPEFIESNITLSDSPALAEFERQMRV